MTRIRLLFIVREPFPTHRADVEVLFGKYLPRLGIHSDYVADAEMGTQADREIVWGGGRVALCRARSSPMQRQLAKALHGILTLLRAKPGEYAAVQVRDLALTASIALVIARFRRLPFFYWMSFPMPEAQISRARAQGIHAGSQFWFPWLQGTLGRVALYRFVLKHADHVFVQSERMRDELVAAGVRREKLTPVPMGVDLESVLPEQRADLEPYRGRMVVVHLGVLDRSRQSERLLDILLAVRREVPQALLVLAGDAEDEEYGRWFRTRISSLGLDDAVLLTGWISRPEAWRYARAADVGVSLFPGSLLLDSASPTKVVECLALGVPMVVNEQPDQEKVIRESGAGLCVPDRTDALSAAIVSLLRDPELRGQMKIRGPAYVEQNRSYACISTGLADRYRQLLGAPGSAASRG